MTQLFRIEFFVPGKSLAPALQALAAYRPLDLKVQLVAKTSPGEPNGRDSATNVILSAISSGQLDGTFHIQSMNAIMKAAGFRVPNSAAVRRVENKKIIRKVKGHHGFYEVIK